MASIYSGPVEPFEPQARPLIDCHPQDDGTDDDNLASSILSSAPKLSSKLNSSLFGPVKPDEVWTIREVSNGEEQLYARGKCVYWTRNSLIMKSFNFTDQVAKVFWTKFNRQDHVCIALTSSLSIFDQIGQHFQILLPFPYNDMYSTPLGLIMERSCDSPDDYSLPVLFALIHPTREISPIIFKPSTKSSANQSKQALSYQIPYCSSIIGCHSTLPYCLLYNSQDGQHSIWKIRETTPQELEDFNRAADLSTTSTFAGQQSNCSLRGGGGGGTSGEGFSRSSLNMSSKQRSSLLHQSNHSSTTTTVNFSPKLVTRGRHPALGNLAASRLGAGAQVTEINATANIRSFNSANTLNSLSTPNRDRIINYLRDNIEEPILPELTLQQVWTEASNSSLRANKFFTTTDLVDDDFVVIVSSIQEQIKIIKADKPIRDNQLVLGRVQFVQALDAAPISSMKMFVVITTSKSFVLYSGFDRITQVTLPYNPPINLRMLPASSPASMKNSVIDMSPIQMSSARKRSSMGERGSLASELSFHQMFHTLSPVPHAKYHESKTSSPVCFSDLKKIDHVIGSTLFLSNTSLNRVRVDVPSICQTQYVRNLLDSMKYLVPRELGLLIVTKWYQIRRTAMQPKLMSAKAELTLFKNWFLSCLGIEGNVFSNEDFTVNLDVSLRPMQSSPSKKSRRNKDIEANPILNNTYTLFYAMHLVLEDLTLTKLSCDIAYSIAELLMILACLLRLPNYQNYYWLKFPTLQKFAAKKNQFSNLLVGLDAPTRPLSFVDDPPSVMDFLSTLTRYKGSANKEVLSLSAYPNIDGVTKNSYTIISLFCEMFGLNKSKPALMFNLTLQILENPRLSREKAAKVSIEPKRSIKADENVVKTMVELGKDRNYLASLPAGINLYLWDAILNCRESPPTDWCKACFELIGRTDLVDLVCGCSTNGKEVANEEDDEDPTLNLLFPDDIRISETKKMLTSDFQVEFNRGQRQGATEEESRDETHRHLYMLNIRTMSMPVGRGAMCLRTYSPVIGETFEVPRLELSGRVFSEERPIEYSHDMTAYPWPFFHNGVAAGLTICASTSNNIIDSTWINYNRPRSNMYHSADMRSSDLTAANINNEHAGFLFALGLNGHLEKLSLMALHDYLCQNNDLTKLAILLGMSAAKRGSRDTNIIKVLSIHVDALLPPNSTELDVSASVHAASIVGVGLLYQASGDSHISKVLLEEIGRLPGPEANSHIDRESYSLSAGLAFGLVNLCKGGSSTISSSDQLRLYMLGGKRKPLTTLQRERYFKQDCHRGEEEYINTHITSPGGTLGLGLMYHRSGNESVANWMRAPDTQTLLENVRPDFLILRMLSYGLIMWDKIEASEEYIDSHIPKIVSLHAFQRGLSPSPPAKLLSLPTVSNLSIDHELISQAYCNIVAGCCMAIAMRFAGSADKNAYKTIYKHTKMLIAMGSKQTLVEQAGRPCIESCLNVLVTSLAIVMAGTGDLGVLRVCRYLRSRLMQSCVFYGSYLSVHISIGILFLGSCRYSLSTSPESIGALICALYPIYPNHSSDNRYHLQALRHLYVLAAEPRLIIPRDILTNKPVYANMTVRRKLHKFNDETKQAEPIELKLRAPCLIPEVDSIENICIDDERYWRIEIRDKNILVNSLLRNCGYLSVKRKAHSSNDHLVSNIETHILENIVDKVAKARKQSALNECVKNDSVEQYSAFNDLLTRSRKVDKKFVCLMLEQINLAATLADSKLINTRVNRVNLLRPVLDSFEKEFSQSSTESAWLDYLSGEKDWTSAPSFVAQYIMLNNLRCPRLDEKLVADLKGLGIGK